MIWNEAPEALVGVMREHGVRRTFLIGQEGRLEASHGFLAPLAKHVAEADDYRAHQGCFFEIGEESGHLLCAFVHQTRRGQAAGGVRFWSYGTLDDLIADGLRLSLAMGQKCALAGLWWGGGKGVIARRPGIDHRDPELRRRVYCDYGRFLSGLSGCYVAAEDVGTTPDDMAWVYSTTRHTTCIPPAFGGSGNPSRLTATGVVVAMEAALEHLGRGGLQSTPLDPPRGTLQGKTVAMQGLGNVAGYMIGDLLERGVGRIVGADIDPRHAEELRRRFPEAPLDLRTVEDSDVGILATPCDVLAPNAVGAVLNPETIPSIQAPIVCGAANNQLANTRRDAEALKARGIVFVPDFLANRMGIVNCANEQDGTVNRDPMIERHLEKEWEHSIHQAATRVFTRSKESGNPPAVVAMALADQLSLEEHPLTGHRGQQIIDSLAADRWFEEGN